jgi:AcrR family transcriptional regulator
MAKPARARREEEELPRRRGRPARLSREQLVDAVMELLARDPRTVPTIARIAEAVGAVPAALYRHFPSQDALFDAVLARILADSEFEFEGARPWQEQLSAWMKSLRSHLIRYPAIFALIGRSEWTSPAWLDASSALVEILALARLDGRALASAYLWILEMTVGLVWQEATLPLDEQIASARASAHALTPAARVRFAPIMPHLQTYGGSQLFEFAIEQAIVAIEAMVHRSTTTTNPT